MILNFKIKIIIWIKKKYQMNLMNLNKQGQMHKIIKKITLKIHKMLIKI